MTATMTSCATAILVEKSILQIMHLIATIFTKTLSQEIFTSKWWLSFKVET